MRRLAAVVIALGIIAGPVVLAPSSQAAVPVAVKALPDVLGCKDSPTPEVPGRGVVGFFESAPDPLPAPADPFAANSGTTIFEQYSYAGLRWSSYDLGCGPDVTRDPDAVIGTAVGNWIMAFPKAGTAATGAILGAAYKPSFLGVFDPLIANVVTALQHAVFERWYVLVLAGLGGWIIWRSRKGSLASTASAIGWALLVMVLATMVFRWPLLAGHAADQAVTATLGGVSAGLNGNDPGNDAGAEVTAGLQESILYQAWLGGMFGDANSSVAKEYGPVIFKATALTWGEADTLQKDPEAGKVIIDAKKHAFEDAAAKIADIDPDAYDYLTGKRSDARVGYAVLAALATLCAVPFLLVAGLLILGALIIVRFGVMLFPVFATLGLFPTMRSLVTGTGNAVAAALINSVVFGIGASVTIMIMGAVIAAPLAAWLHVVLLLLVTVVMWAMLKPHRRLTQMAGNRDVFREGVAAPGEAVRSAGRFTRRAASAALTAATAGATAGVVAGKVLEEEPQVPQRAEATTSVPRKAIDAPASVVVTGRVTNVPPAPPAKALTGRHAAPVESETGEADAPSPRFESTQSTPVHQITSLPHPDPEMAELAAMLQETKR